VKLGRVGDRDSLFRHCIYPISVKKTGLVLEKMWFFEAGVDGLLHGSLAWDRYLPTSKYVHGYGCRLAAGINERKKAAGKLNERNRHYYCGAYSLSGEAVRALATTPEIDEIVFADVVHLIEQGEIAHTDFRVRLKSGTANVEATKTAIIDRLWNACSGPLTHVCDCDKNILEHQSSNLPTAPIGDFIDSRSWLTRRWCLVRFHGCDWVWRNSHKYRICSWLWRVISRA
jgi:hypothetical protein